MEFSIEEYTDEEKKATGNMIPGGKLHDKIIDYFESQGYEDVVLNDISMGVWKAIEAMKKALDQQKADIDLHLELKTQLQECDELINIILRQSMLRGFPTPKEWFSIVEKAKKLAGGK